MLARRAGPSKPFVTLHLPEILYEDNHCLAVAKPAGCLSTHFAGKEETLDRIVKAYLKKKYRKPGNVFLGIVHRLDRVVSGVLLFARTSKAAARLAEQFREATVEKVYWAVVEGEVQESSGVLEAWLKKDSSIGRVEVVRPETPGAKKASLHYLKRGSQAGLTWLEIRPRTGRTHQLRVQLAHLGHPIFGDVVMPVSGETSHRWKQLDPSVDDVGVADHLNIGRGGIDATPHH